MLSSFTEPGSPGRIFAISPDGTPGEASGVADCCRVTSYVYIAGPGDEQLFSGCPATAQPKETKEFCSSPVGIAANLQIVSNEEYYRAYNSGMTSTDRTIFGCVATCM